MTRRRWLLVAVWTLPSAVFLAITAFVYGAYRIAPPSRLGPAERAAIIAPLRAALMNTQAPACTVAGRADTIAVTVWLDGHTLVRVDGYGTDLCGAAVAAARTLRTQATVRAQTADALARARIQVDVLVGHAPLGGAFGMPGIADQAAINPGIEGIGADANGRTAYVLPHELVAMRLLAIKQPTDQTPDLVTAVDPRKVASVAGARVGVGRLATSALFRFRTDTFVEQPVASRDEPPLPLTRGVPPAPVLTRAALREAALAGGRYLVAHEAPNGRYVYEHDLVSGQKTDPLHNTTYSMPRHAGTTYFLAELYRITKEAWLREPIERAFDHLVELMAGGRCAGTLPDGTAFDCVLDRGEQLAQLGSTALAVVAFAEYQRATGDARYQPLAEKLGTWLVFMQRPDGSFRHLYDPRTKRPDESSMQLYYSGEAALALARLASVTGNPRYAQAAERAVDWLVDWYDFFLGGFFYGEEHWTCIAAEALWPAVKKPAYEQFCEGYGEFLRGQQPRVGDAPDEDDLAGTYTFTPFVPVYNTPAGSRSEAMISAYLLGVHHGHPDERLRGQIRRALQYALGQQVRPESDFSVAGEADGGIPAGPIDRTVRIDYVQHVCSAMIRASELLE